MIFLHLLEMLGDSTSVDIQSASDFSGSDIPIAGDKVQNGISRFWSTFLVHLLLLLLYLSNSFHLHFDISYRNIFFHRFPVFKDLVSQVLRVLSCPSDGLLVSSLQVEVHELFHHRFAFSRDTFVEEKLVLNLGHGEAFDGGGVGDDRVEIELLIVKIRRIF